MTTTSDITALTPNKLWQWFATICSIPHASYQEEALAKHIMDWAAQKNLQAYRDTAGNIFITKPATPGMEGRAPIALQAHLDMVCQANHDYDFVNLPIEPIIDGEWVRANGTTLGADNGIGLASILAVLDSDDVAHPLLEAVLTMTEETGMDGAFNLERGRLTSRLMINTDTEEIDEIYLGCAGGVDVEMALDVSYDDLLKEHTLTKLSVSGLKGGHSGLDIHKNNSNAILLLAYLLAELPLRIVTLSGGTARNAIPRQATAIIACDGDTLDTIRKRAVALQALIGGYETQVTVDFVTLDNMTLDKETHKRALTRADSEQVLNFLNALPNGVLRYSDSVPNTVETSLSLGKVALTPEHLSVVSLVRSLNETGKQIACSHLQSVARLACARIDFVGSYVGWEPNPSSPITALTFDIYKKVIGTDPALKVIHAGLECGLIQEAYPTMDIVSIGPTIKNAHSPDECVHIASVATYWQVLTQVLANSPKL